MLVLIKKVFDLFIGTGIYFLHPQSKPPAKPEVFDYIDISGGKIGYRLFLTLKFNRRIFLKICCNT